MQLYVNKIGTGVQRFVLRLRPSAIVDRETQNAA